MKESKGSDEWKQKQKNGIFRRISTVMTHIALAYRVSKDYNGATDIHYQCELVCLLEWAELNTLLFWTWRG